MTIIKRADLGRPLTWDELDDNFQQVDDLTAAASAAVSSASASATAAATSATASATSATDAANSAANASAAIVSAVKSTITFTTGGTLNSNLDRISDGTYLYYWTGAYPVTIPADSTMTGTGGLAEGFWAVDTDLLLRTSLSSSTGADMIGTAYPGVMSDTIDAITPEMFEAVGDGVANDTAAVQAAIEAAKSAGHYRVEGKGRYRIFSPIKLDNLGQGFRLDLQDVIADATFPSTSDWKTANGIFEIGGESNGSMVGVEVRVGFASGNNVATLFKLKGYGAGGSYFFGGRVQNCVGVYDCTNSTLANSNSNYIEGLYWLNGTYGIRNRRSGSFVVEAPKIKVGFMTGMKYGGIQLFNGSQYFSINATGIDFCGRNLTQLTVNALPPVSVRETLLTNDATGSTFEVLDVYQQFSGTYSILVIEPVSSEGGSTNFSTGQTVTVGGVTYTISAVTTSVTSQAYFDFIHAFQGASFSRGYAQFDYLSRAVGGNFNGTTLYFYNSFQEVTNSVNNIWMRQQGTSVKMVDRWTGTNLLDFNTSSNGLLTLPSGINTGGTSTLGGKMYLGPYQVFGQEFNTTLVQSTTKAIRTMSYLGNGTVTTTKEMYRVTVAGPNGLTGVGGQCTIAVDPSGAEVLGASGVNGITVTTSGFVVNAVQGSQANMVVTFTFERK